MDTCPHALLERVADEARFLVEATRVGCGPPGPRRHRSERLGSRRGGAGVVEIGASHRGSGRGGAGVVAPGDEDRITGSAWCETVPQRPARRPLTMPRSTAHRTGLVRAGVAEGTLLGDGPRWSRRGPRHAPRTRGGGSRRRRASPRALSVDPPRGTCVTRANARTPRPRGRPWPPASSGPSRWHGLAQQAHRGVRSRRCMRPRGRASSTPKYRLDGRPAPAGIAAGLHAQVAPVGEAAEVVAGHVGVQGEGRSRPRWPWTPGVPADVEEDVAPRRVAERGGDGGDGRAEAARRPTARGARRTRS